MKCQVCGNESGKYPLCRVCNLKKEQGEVIKCGKCGKWHYSYTLCQLNQNSDATANTAQSYLYDLKRSLISKTEQDYYKAIRASLPENYWAFPQVNLASFILRNDDARYHNELFRNVDFLITDAEYRPKFIVEINDQTHLNFDRKERDEKVRKICEEAGIPIVCLWTSYGVNPEYIRKRFDEVIQSLPAKRIRHSAVEKRPQEPATVSSNYPTERQSYVPRYKPRSSGGCYIATCVYGSYDCPEVWVLRRYRDCNLSATWWGTCFVKLYYLISPTAVKLFGKQRWFHKIFRPILNNFIKRLRAKGYDDAPYEDAEKCD